MYTNVFFSPLLTKPRIDEPLSIESKTQLKEKETELTQRMMDNNRFYELSLCSNYDARCGFLMPPCGYVATIHKEELFNYEMMDRHLFRGVAILELPSVKENFSDVTIADWKQKINVFIRDESINPPLASTFNTHRWQPSLGPFGWISVCLNTKTNCHAIIVVSSLDQKTYEEMEGTMIQMTEEGKTVEYAMGKLEVYRGIAKKNRNALLTEVAMSMGLQHMCLPDYTQLIPPTLPDTYLDEQEKDDFISIVGTTHLPLYYVFPKRIPRGTKLKTKFTSKALWSMKDNEINASKRTPHYVDVFMDIIIEDLVPHENGRYIRLSNCCHETSPKIQLQGPLQPILLSLATQNTGDELGCFPAQSKVNRDGKGINDARTKNVTWEDGDINFNQCCNVDYLPFDKPLPDPITIYNPIMVRVSCENDVMQAYPVDQVRVRLGVFGRRKWNPL